VCVLTGRSSSNILPSLAVTPLVVRLVPCTYIDCVYCILLTTYFLHAKDLVDDKLNMHSRPWLCKFAGNRY
jgi:hypothetical protein